MSLKTFIAKIGSFFIGLFNAAKKAYNQLPEAEKEALLTGSGIIALINDGLERTPIAVREAIIAQFPKIPVEKILAGINSILAAFGIDAVGTIEEGISHVQSKLATAEGKAWALASETAAKAFAIVIAPPDMKYARIAALMEYVYQTFFKKK